MGTSRHGAHSASRQGKDPPVRARPAGLRPEKRPPPPEPADDDGNGRLSRVEEFSKWLAGVVPVGLIPNDLAEVLQHRANSRLDMARDQGISIEHIYFGEDCLPTWPTLCWDPEQESLHSILQERLGDLQLALDLGALLQQDIRNKSNARMEKARELGVELNAVAIGSSLLPEWNTASSVAETSSNTETPQATSASSPNGISAHEREKAEYPLTPSSIAEKESPETRSVDDASSGDFEMLAANPDREPALLRPTSEDEPNSELGRASEMSGSGSGSGSSDDEDEDEKNPDDEDEDGAQDIYLNNHVSSQPIYDEHGRSNIIYDVDLVGHVPGEFSNVDLEIYLAVDDDEEYASLPEAELAIEGEAYERCFGDEGAIDVHIPGAEIFCFNGIEESDEAEQQHHHHHHHQESCHEEHLQDTDGDDVELEELTSSGSETCSEEE
ncbi:hypothetical protein C2857_004703 [Epichloe festucae Fl1]|uniref:Uncharacterized protein n=1 Tax=Epichloe festucae (strain Fl1) TaxID=877507 RepID=A0A7S9PS41_EPIFF|nr:hypothetical protein C2857_004703 [Epichloe festucae Fl1]